MTNSREMMIKVTTKEDCRTTYRKGNGITLKKVLVLIVSTSMLWFLMDVLVINFYNSQQDEENFNLPVAQRGIVSKNNYSIPKLGNSESRINVKEVGGNFSREIKPKLARLLKKRKEDPIVANKNFTHIQQEDTRLALEPVARKNQSVEGFHYVQFIDKTTKPRNISGLGEHGKGVITREEEKQFVKRQWNHNFFNEYVSDLISVERSLPDFRPTKCKDLKVSNELPKTSVIMCFCEESWSTLLRSVHSIINRSPPELIEEIILIDDFSQRKHLKEPLDKYMAQFPIVKVVHLKERHGLVRARIVGVEMSKAPIVTFLDSHIECSVGWLEPLLQRIKEDRRNVVCPIIEPVDATTFSYGHTSDTLVGDFKWDFSFSWRQLDRNEISKRSNEAAPLQSPTMAGGLFSIEKAYFGELGMYDEGYEVWGAENLELSFKIWMCGGRLEVLPCSRVGHIFRKAQPYSFPDNDNTKTFHHNTLRMVEVWVDEPYKSIFFDKVPDMNGVHPGDLSKQQALRQMLQCKDFQWYMDNICPWKYVPTLFHRAKGTVSSPFSPKICLDNMGQSRIGLYNCHGRGTSQLFFLTWENVITNDDKCLYNDNGNLSKKICRSSNATFTHNGKEGQIIDEASGKCLQIEKIKDQYRLFFSKCNNSQSQKWVWQHYYDKERNEI